MILQTLITTQSALQTESNAIIILLKQNFSKKDLPEELMKNNFDLMQFLEESKFTGGVGSSCSISISIKPKKIIHLFFVGIGSAQENKFFDIEMLRRAIGSGIKWARSHQYSDIALQIPSPKDFNCTLQYLTEQITTISYIAFYRYDKFITSISSKERSKIVELFFCVDAKNKKGTELRDAQHGHATGVIVAQAVNTAREWIDTPPSQLTPTIMAQHAKTLAKEQGLGCTIFGEKEIIKMGMNGLAGVSAGSDQDAQFVILEYKTKKAKAPTIAFVGKGITFDSGGLSIKPANSMEDMKEDMAGAASVINAIAAIAQLKPDINVVALAAITENMPGCRAQKPGDIVTFYNGKTAEVRNTDAEGRLVLADALSYAVKHFKLDAVIDVATLTGACIYAVGPFFAALLSDNDTLSNKVVEAGKMSGNPVWRLPFTPDFKEAIKSPIADMQNVGNPSIAAGTITAACFLRNFTGDVPWVHLDIASSAFNVPNISYYGKGATGYSVRLLIELAMNWK